MKLLEDYQCQVFLYASDLPPAQGLVNSINADYPITSVAVPNQELFYLDSNSSPMQSEPKRFQEASLEPLLAFHTSGTTGLPKPIVVNQGALAVLESGTRMHLLGYEPAYFEYWRDMRVFLPFPMFHAAGFGVLIAGLYYGFTVVFAPNAPPTADLMYQVLKQGNLEVATIPPSILAEMSTRSEHLDALGRMKYILTGGGPLAKTAGNLIASRSHVIVAFGSTEAGTLLNELPEPEDWSYVRFSPSMGVEMKPYSGGLFESVFVRKPDLKLFQPVFYMLPELDEFSTNDLWSQHPTKKGLWRHETRIDDIIVYSTGEKFNPVTMEGDIASHPKVAAALVLGRGRFQSALLVEATSHHYLKTDEGRRGFREAIWPFVDKANQNCPRHARIFPEFVIFTSEAKPLPRAGKGTVQRQLAEKLYEQETEAVYQDSTKGVTRTSTNVLDDDGPLERSILMAISKFPGCMNVGTKDNIFEQGFDSLSVMSLARDLNVILDRHGDQTYTTITPNIVYSNPTAQDLAVAIQGSKDPRVRALDNPVEVYNKSILNLPLNERPSQVSTSQEQVVLLIGSTGSLGSYILQELMCVSNVAKIYCLNRGKDSKLRQQDLDQSRGLPLKLDNSRVEFLDCLPPSPNSEYLGLEMTQYRTLLRSVTCVVLNAWHVDFNLSLRNYSESHVRRVRQLVEFSSHSLHNASIHFISSIGAVENYPDARVSEQVLTSFDVSHPSGYAQSKLIAECILDSASIVSRVPTFIYRVGQIAGPTTEKGEWNRQEWFPLILRSAAALGTLPATLGPLEAVDWLPVDKLGKALVELISVNHSQPNDRLEQAPGPRVYHLVNPRKTKFADLLDTILKHDSLNLPAMPLPAWVEKLEGEIEKAKSLADLQSNIPASKLLGFFKGLVSMENDGKKQVVLDTTLAERDSDTLRNMEAVNSAWLDNWIRQWNL